MIVNDVHSRLNPTDVAEVVAVDTLEGLQEAIARAREAGRAVALAGGLHSMGGQQFAAGGTLVDTRPLARVLGFDSERGSVEVEAGMQWPELIDHLIAVQRGEPKQWGIVQKQSGADGFTIGGSISANGHGRGLTLPPMAADVESIRLVQTDGSLVSCSREENQELFGLATGGYGLFGAIYSVTLRLAPREKLERDVELADVEQLADSFADRIARGYRFGDFQFAVDPDKPDFLRRGILSCYRPAEQDRPIPENQQDRPIPENQQALTLEDWQSLLVLAHTDKSRAFDEYARHYLGTSGQLYWSDLHQLSDYVGGYHEELDKRLGAERPASELITELYVPRERLSDFMGAAADALRKDAADVIYGTIRLIEPDVYTYLAWAREPYACVIFNLHTVHSDEGIAHAAQVLRGLIDLAIERGGSFFLTYHRFASREQVSTCYPQFVDFLRLKRTYDPDEVFQSDWYRHNTSLFADEL